MNEEKGFCTECAQNMKDKWPELADKLVVCPDCSSAKVKGKKTTYKMTGANKPPYATRTIK